MIVRTLADVTGSDQDVTSKTWRSKRLIVRRDGAGFSVHETIMFAGTKTRMWYRNHVEAVFCLSGEGSILDEETGEHHRIGPGTLYLLDRHDRHVLAAETELRMICIFAPALIGSETHDESGSYPA
jgi:L-ectoine synthase